MAATGGEEGMRMRRVLVAVDFGTPSLAAARWVARHLTPEAEIVLAHVLPVPDAPAFLRGHVRSPASFAREVTPPMRGGLEGLAEALGAARVRTVLRVGVPAEELLDLASLHEVDLIAVGRPRGRGETVRLGRNLVDRLLRTSPVPVLQAAGPLTSPPSTVLAALDGGIASENVAGAAWAVAEGRGARLTALHVLDDDLRAYVRAMEVAAGAAADAQRAEEALTSTASAWLDATLHGAGVHESRRSVLVAQGDPGHEILAASRKPGTELIVLGRDGHDARSRHTVGSTTRLVLRGAAVPVLVVPGAPERMSPVHPGSGRGVRRAPLALTVATAGAGRREPRHPPGDGDGMPPAA